SSTTADAYSGLEFYGGAAGTTWGGGLLRDQSTNDLSIWTANSGSVPKITILNTGLVGIGTTAPGANLTVAGGKLQVTGNTAPTSGAGVELGHDGTTGSLVSYDRTGSEYKAMRFNALNLNFENSGVEYMRITGGKVGIGTTNPTSTLTLKNTPSASTPVILYVNNSNAEMFRISAPVSSTVFIGSNAGGISNTGANNFAVGTDALCTNTSGHSNNAFGNMALSGNLTGGHNNAFGDSALSGTTVSNNSAFGDTELMFDSTGHDNSAFGASALLMNETGIYNNAFGSSALAWNTTANYNNAFGNSALANSNGAANNAFGYQALTANTSGTHNIAFGYMALFANEIGTRNIAIGTQALYVNNGVAAEGSYNVSVGYQSMLANTTGYGNVGMGYSALSDLTTGYYNVAVGYGAGPVAGTPALHHTVALGYNATPLADHEMRFSSSQTLYYMYGTWVNASDRRLKKNITDYAVGLDFIKNLKPVSYELIKDEGVIGKRYEGFIAQDVEETMNTLHVQFGGLYKPPSTAPSDSPMGISYERLVVPLVNAVKEQQTQIESLAKQLTHISLSTTDGLNIEKIAGIDQYAVRNTKDNSVMNQIGAFAEVVVGKIRAGILETKQLIVDGVDVAKKLTELSDKVIELSNKVESQQKQIEELKTEIKMLDAGR
ncbi:tail fiber domain-containing protein, partial [Patescibacteria group bacterium]|nr:tail fiber domain-containing protein [Patescibacteria group bacterium]